MLSKDIFKKNEYPEVIHIVDKKQVLLVLPFLGLLPFEIRSCLQKCFKNYIPYCSLRLVYQSKIRIPNLFTFKDDFNTNLSSHTIYKFRCSCCNATCYDRTRRHFLERASVYLRATPLIGTFFKTPKKSAIFGHMLLDSHKSSFDSFSRLSVKAGMRNRGTELGEEWEC